MAKQNKKQTSIKAVKEPTDEQLQGNQHDKIIKESIEETMHFMLKTFGNIDVVKSEQLPTEIQQTQERKPDFLKIITDKSGLKLIGHLEFHVKDEADISYRAFETCAMMKRKKPYLDIRQIIVYMGSEPAKNIISELSGSHFSYKLQLVQFIKTPVDIFLQAESAAEIVLGILGDFGNQPPETIISQLVDKVVECAKTDLERLKFLKHLQIFSKLRNFEPLINKIMDNIIGHFGLKDEDDYMYKRGMVKAETLLQKRLEQNQRFTVIGLLDITALTEVQIITSFNVSADMIQAVKKDLAAAPKKIARLKAKLSAEQIAQQLDLPIHWVEKHIQC